MQLQDIKHIYKKGGKGQDKFGYQEMMFLVFLCLLQPSAAIPMQFPYRGSNSEEGPQYGPYNYPNLQMSQAGPMYGFGLPHYAQMIQMQQALSQQKFPWQPQGHGQTQQNNRETIAPQMPTLQIKPQHQFIPEQQPQHVTKQPLQLPPAPNSQTPPMFLPFGSPMNPFWPQGNYFGFFGMGGRQPYNSEEANEDEEPAKEKEPPKTEPPVTEPNNTTIADTNTTTVEHGLGNNTVQNESLVGINPLNPNVRVDGQRIPSSGGSFPTYVHGRQVRILPGAPRPQNHIIRLPNGIIRNPQHRYYAINRVPLANRNQQKQPHPSNHVINKASPIHLRPSEKREETFPYQEPGLRRVVIPGSSNVREILHNPKHAVFRNNIQQYPGNRKPIAMSQQREHPNRATNNLANRNVLMVYPQDPYPQDSVFPDENINIPRGIYANEQNGLFHSKPSEAEQKTNFPEHNGATVIQNSKSGPVSTDSVWSNRHHIPEMSKGDSGPLHKTIYLVSSFPSVNDPHNNPKQEQWDIPAYQGNTHLSAGQREIDIYPENEPYAKINPTPAVENQNWKVNDFTTQHENVQPQPYRRLVPLRNTQNTALGQNRREFYINTNERYPLNQRQFLLVSKPGPLKTQEQVFSTNRSSYKFQNVSPQKPDSTLNYSPVFTRLENDSPNLNANIPEYSPNRPFDHAENIPYTHGDEIHVDHNSPVDYQISPFSETQPWIYNPEDIPSEPKEQTNYGSYPSGLRGQPSNQREIEMGWNGGSRHYICSLPFEDDPGRGLPNSLLYLCCKLSHTEQGSPPGTVDSMHDFRLPVKEYNDWVPHQDRTHKQHTRNVMDSPKIGHNQQSMSNCNSSANEMVMASGREPSEGPPYIRKFENVYQGFDVAAKTPCSPRGDNFLLPKQEMPSFQGKNFVVQDGGSQHGGGEKKGPGKLLRILTCPQDAQTPVADLPSDLARDKPNAFSMKHDTANGETSMKTQGENLMLHQPSEPLSSTPDCLILNK